MDSNEEDGPVEATVSHSPEPLLNRFDCLDEYTVLNLVLVICLEFVFCDLEFCPTSQPLSTP